MPSAEFRKAISAELPVLFVNIGWATYYDGTEIIIGNHKYLRENSGSRTSETKAFAPSRNIFRCGISYGKVPPSLHVVFVARDRRDKQLKAVGLYACASSRTDKESGWVVAQTRFAHRIPVESVPGAGSRHRTSERTRCLRFMTVARECRIFSL